MTAWQIIFPWTPAMAILLVVSGLMSGSEAALFSLQRRDLEQMSKAGRGDRRAVALLRDPEHLLSGVLFLNLLVNMTYFAIVGILGGRLEKSEGSGAGTVVTFTLANLLIVIFFSEMLPKSVAVLAPRTISRLCSFPLSLVLKLIDPVLPLVATAITLTRRLIWPGFEPEPEIDLDAIRRAIDLGTGDAVLAAREQSALRNLIELADLRADDCMRPRSSLALCRPPIVTENLVKLHSQNLIAAKPGGPAPSQYLLVIEPGGDHIVGSINLEQLRPGQVSQAAARIEPVCYVPWSSNVSDVLDLLQRKRLNVAAIVNEFGDTVGALSVEDILEQILVGRATSFAQAAETT